MPNKPHILLALDVGGKRIGVAQGDSDVKLAYPLTTLQVDGTEWQQLQQLIDTVTPTTIVIGYPRNQSGEPTKQTELVELFSEQLKRLGVPCVFQDESLTSVLAEERLKKSATKPSVDAEAATIILQDYLEKNYGY